MKKLVFVTVLMLAIAGFAGCGQQEDPQTEVTFDEFKCPIEVLSSSKSISPISTFNLTVKNVYPYDVTGFNAGAIFFDENNKPLSTEPINVPYEASLDPIKPDTTVELQSLGDDKAVSMKIVIKDCIYMKMNPVDELYGKLPFKWENPNYDKEIKALIKGN